MQAGNKLYSKLTNFPSVIPIFPLSGALLLPGGNMPLNIFEPRYLQMTDHALANDRLIGMIQPDQTGKSGSDPILYKIGCVGRLTGFQETGDGRYMINLNGICRFEVVKEIAVDTLFRQAQISMNLSDLKPCEEISAKAQAVNRDLLLETFKRYLAANNMETDWDAVNQTDDETLVNALCMMSPYGPAEKQALLEAEDLFTRAETLVALTEMALAKADDDPDALLQ